MCCKLRLLLTDVLRNSAGACDLVDSLVRIYPAIVGFRSRLILLAVLASVTVSSNNHLAQQLHLGAVELLSLSLRKRSGLTSIRHSTPYMSLEEAHSVFHCDVPIGKKIS